MFPPKLINIKFMIPFHGFNFLRSSETVFMLSSFIDRYFLSKSTFSLTGFHLPWKSTSEIPISRINLTSQIFECSFHRNLFSLRIFESLYLLLQDFALIDLAELRRIFHPPTPGSTLVHLTWKLGLPLLAAINCALLYKLSSIEWGVCLFLLLSLS